MYVIQKSLSAQTNRSSYLDFYKMLECLSTNLAALNSIATTLIPATTYFFPTLLHHQ